MPPLHVPMTTAPRPLQVTAALNEGRGGATAKGGTGAARNAQGDRADRSGRRDTRPTRQPDPRASRPPCARESQRDNKHKALFGRAHYYSTIALLFTVERSCVRRFFTVDLLRPLRFSRRLSDAVTALLHAQSCILPLAA